MTPRRALGEWVPAAWWPSSATRGGCGGNPGMGASASLAPAAFERVRRRGRPALGFSGSVASSDAKLVSCNILALPREPAYHCEIRDLGVRYLAHRLRAPLLQLICEQPQELGAL